MDDDSTLPLDALATDFPALVGITEENVIHTETRLDEPVAVIDDAAFAFGAAWAQYSDENPLIVFDAETWDALGESSRDFVVAHEAAERDAARDAGDVNAGISPSDIVDRHHNAANVAAVDVVGEAAATRYAREMFDFADEYAHDQAMHVLRGIEHLVPEHIRSEAIRRGV